MKVTFSIDHWELKAPFVTAADEVFSIETLTVFIQDGTYCGRGEALGVDYLGETAQGLSHEVMACSSELDAGMGRDRLQQLMRPGGARNAVDCALWDLECQRSGRRAWALAGMAGPHPVNTVYTLSLDTVPRMAEEAGRHADFSVLKVKLDAASALERLTAIRTARPDAELLIDANGSWDLKLLERLGDELARLEIAMVEQPLPRGADQALAGLRYPVPLVADESCQGLAELDAVAGLYQGVNIKLDKCGGLTEALALQERAHALGLETMVGNMLGSSLAMAPGFLIAQGCRWVDLDGPLWQRADRAPAIRFENGLMHAPAAALWG